MSNDQGSIKYKYTSETVSIKHNHYIIQCVFLLSADDSFRASKTTATKLTSKTSIYKAVGSFVALSVMK